MDPAVRSSLQSAESDVAASERLIVDQCRLIASLEHAGANTAEAIALFREMERRLLQRVANRDRLLAYLGLADAGAAD